MSLNRSATRISPLLLRHAATRHLPRNSRRFPREISAIAILIPTRGLATQTQNQTPGNSSYPPPGFNADEAKKSLSKDGSSASRESSKSDLIEQVTIPKDQPTSHPKTAATEDQSLKELAAAKAAEDSKVVEQKKEDKKLTLWQKVKKEANHYWDGTKLLATEVRISSKLALKMAAGYELTRRENRQLQRTVQDLGRLVPFSVFVIVPFAELLLPVALKLFPNMLPSTYEGQKSKDAKASTLRTTRKEVSNFLRQTLKETGLPVSAANAQTEEFADFFRKVRTTGEAPTAADVIKVCKVFKDDLTLDNLSRPQLVGICRYMNMNTFGTDNFLRYQVRHRMRQIKRDDKAIAFEGVETLSVPELQTACQSRGLRTQSMSPGRLRDDLQMWLDLRLKYGVPSTLLVLSNAFMYATGKESEINNQIDALQAVLSSIPEELFHEIELEVHTAEGAATNKQRLEVLKEQQELIDEENEQSQKGDPSGRPQPKDDQDIDEEEKLQAKQEAEHKAATKDQEQSDEDRKAAIDVAAEDRPDDPEQKRKELLDEEAEIKDENKRGKN
ncbi:LETM1-domain-containing protein [Pseudovirgaria hyperparasitica]|uniref:LETM1-domain-containing protein n=1 Tax=Pseudovirgaria hyperparasitica TaxID=470096 RepID=A0A6A6VU03_9PEZI|nr:LETM1-domain-containing protein [Pseudovirgaria hyperparasitica]KAF2753214.1 LETM1-domain-containing protein [Pseudovirgaria hyperparasitica]